MTRFFFSLMLVVSSLLPWPTAGFAQAADGLPARPSPFRFVTDEAQLLSEANRKTLENGLRSYADNTGTQIVVVTVPTLGGRTVADYGRALGEAWGVGQRGKNNGVVLLLSGQERQVTIQAGAGLQDVITPTLTARIINQQMTPSFKQGSYFAGIRKGLNTLMLAANPGSNPDKENPTATAEPTATAGTSNDLNATPPAPTTADPATEPFRPQAADSSPEPAGLGIGLGVLAVGALVVGGVIWLLVRLFRRRSTNNATAANAPDFSGNRPAGSAGNVNRGGGPPPQGPDFYGNRSGSGMGNVGSSGMGGGGMGSILATGAAAAAGAYLGNRMANGGHDESGAGQGLGGYGNQPSPLDAGTAGATGGAAGGSSGFPALDGGAGADETAPDYFSGENTGPDYFSSDDNSAYDDTASDDTGGGDFNSDDDNSGSW